MLIDAASKNGAHLIHGHVETVKPTRGVVDRVGGECNGTALRRDRHRDGTLVQQRLIGSVDP